MIWHYMFFVYILYAPKFDRFYIGQTADLSIRLKQHNDGAVKPTRHYRPWLLAHKEPFDSRSDALKREHFLKKQRNKDFYRRLANDFFENRL